MLAEKEIERRRAQGGYWERQFCKMAARYEKLFTPMQIGRAQSITAHYRSNTGWNTLVLPDVTIWSHPGEHHEIKHKNPTRHGQFGLEQYRLDSLLRFADETQQAVYYTIHNHDLSGGAKVRVNNLDHWVTVNVVELAGMHTYEGRGSIRNGTWSEDTLVLYWPDHMFWPLRDLWEFAKE